MVKTYVVSGATGHVGSIVAEKLLAAGKKVRVIGRNRERLQRFSGAEYAVGSLDDFEFVNEAYHGAEAAFVMIPPNFSLKQGGFRAYQNRVALTQIEAMRKNGIRFAVTLSSIGAHVPRGNGPVGGLYDMEKAFLNLGNCNVLHLRPGYFMENLLANLGMVKKMGLLGGPASPDTRISFIATKDIGAVACERLLELSFHGQGFLELMGAMDYTMPEVAGAIGEAIGNNTLRYVQFSYSEAEKAMVDMGLPGEIAGLFVELNKGFNEGLRSETTRTAKNTTTTTIAEFARNVFAPLYSQAKG